MRKNGIVLTPQEVLKRIGDEISDFRGATINGSLIIKKQEIHWLVLGGITGGATIEGDLTIVDVKIIGALNLSNTTIRGNLLIERSEFYEIVMCGAVIEGETQINEVTTREKIVLDGSSLKGGLKISQPTTGGHISLVGVSTPAIYILVKKGDRKLFISQK